MNYFSFPFFLHSFLMPSELSLICLVNVLIFSEEEIQNLATLLPEPCTILMKDDVSSASFQKTRSVCERDLHIYWNIVSYMNVCKYLLQCFHPFLGISRHRRDSKSWGFFCCFFIVVWLNLNILRILQRCSYLTQGLLFL